MLNDENKKTAVIFAVFVALCLATVTVSIVGYSRQPPKGQVSGSEVVQALELGNVRSFDGRDGDRCYVLEATNANGSVSSSVSISCVPGNGR